MSKWNVKQWCKHNLIGIRMMKTKLKVRNNMGNKNWYVEANLCDLVYA